MSTPSNNAPLDQAFEKIYADLKTRARMSLSRLPHGETLTATALVSEAYVKLAHAEQLQLEGDRHFYALAAQAMRQIIIDHARSASSQKRGGDLQMVTLNWDRDAPTPSSEELIDLDFALEELGRLSPRQARLVELKFFAGLSIDDIARLLEISSRSAWREWKRARAFLLVKLRRS